MLSKSRLALLLLPALLFPGCAINMNMPVPRFDTSEAQGKLGKGYAGIGIASGNKLQLVPDTTASPPLHAPTFDGASDFPMLADVGLLESLDFEVRAQNPLSGETPTLFKLKYQFLGDPRITARKGNFSAAATFGGGASFLSQTDSASLSNIVAQSSASFWALDFGLIAGYRPDDLLLIYGGPFLTHYGYSGSITQTAGSSPGVFAVAPTPLTSFSGSANQTGLNLGVAIQPSGVISARLEVAYANAGSGGASSSGFSAGGLLLFLW